MAAYREYEGDMQQILEVVILCDNVEDEDRFRKILQEAIDAEEVQHQPIAATVAYALCYMIHTVDLTNSMLDS